MPKKTKSTLTRRKGHGKRNTTLAANSQYSDNGSSASNSTQTSLNISLDDVYEQEDNGHIQMKTSGVPLDQIDIGELVPKKKVRTASGETFKVPTCVKRNNAGPSNIGNYDPDIPAMPTTPSVPYVESYGDNVHTIADVAETSTAFVEVHIRDDNLGEANVPNDVPDDPIQEDIENALTDFAIDIERERIDNVENARIEDANVREALANFVEEQRNRVHQIPTYLLAANIDDNVQEYNMGAFIMSCEHCLALHFACERTTRLQYTACCANGQVQLPPMEETPAFLKMLLQDHHQRSRHFKDNIIRYNYAFQFASTQAHLREFQTAGPYVYSIQGKVLHQLSNIDLNNITPKYGQMYFLDPQDAINRRMDNANNVLDGHLIVQLETMLRTVNPFVEGYTYLSERYRIEMELAELNNREMPCLVLEFQSVHGANNHTFNVPMVNEVAVVYEVDNDMAGIGANLRVYLKNRPDRFHTIHQDNSLCDPLTFPLLFPRGTQGWHHQLRRANNVHRLTLTDYYGYRFAYRTRPDEAFNIFQFAGKLFQQYVVLAYTKIESNRLQYISQNQNLLRAEAYNGLADYLHRYGEQRDINIGRMVILPSTYIGSPRNMMQLFQDSLAVVQKLGQPSLFVTMTCNPKWKEIVDNIRPGEAPGNHPLLLARVFQAKLKELLHDIEYYQVMGVSICRVYVIEFQKRGLPHAHVLLIMRAEDRMEDAVRIDSLIRAELPDPDTEPELYDVICKNNIHGPCGPHTLCFVNNKCTKHFPKPFCDETTIDEKGFVAYKRRDNGRIARVIRNQREVIMDNRFVVPYNGYFSLKYRCHINVEACPQVRAIKYLYKYIWKGSDHCLVRINAENDFEYNEVEAYLSARYLAPSEASWRILTFPMHENTHTVHRLPVHLPNEQAVIFQRGNAQQALQRNNHTKLTRWFELNQNDPNARQYLYQDIPIHYVWKENVKNWQPRQRGGNTIISRIYAISVRQGELYYLRLLLLHVRGAQNWEELRTVDETVCDTFREACSRRNLLQDDAEWIRCMTEASQSRMSYQIRNLFVCILVFCEVENRPRLWELFCDAMIEDYLHADPHLQRDAAMQMALIDIQRTLSVHNKRLAEYHLPEANANLLLEDAIDSAAERVVAQTNRANLNREQAIVYETIVQAIHSNQNSILPPLERLFVINSAGGTGKSFLFNTLIAKLAGDEMGVITCCFSGIAATVLTRGRTIHSTFKLKLKLDETCTSGISPNSIQGRFMANAKLVLIDEISMIPKLMLSIIEKTLKDVTNNNTLFGGKVVVLSGDFRQLLPIIERANRATIVSECLKNSYLWPHFTQLALHTNIRANPNEIEFRNWLLQLGDAQLPTYQKNNTTNLIKIPDQCVVDDKHTLIAMCFDGIRAGDCWNHAILTPTNEQCNAINQEVLHMIEGQEKLYTSADALDETDENVLAANYTVEYLNTLNPSGFPEHNLRLKVGTIVLLLRNLNVKKGLCNGTKLLIKELHNNYISAERLSSGTLTGDIVFLPRIDCNTTDTNYPIPFRRRQFPIKLAYSMTINKSQGQTLDKVGIYLSQPVFSHGAMYVAASRARSFDTLHICIENTPEQGIINGRPGQYAKNIVYAEALA